MIRVLIIQHCLSTKEALQDVGAQHKLTEELHSHGWIGQNYAYQNKYQNSHYHQKSIAKELKAEDSIGGSLKREI